MPRVPLRDAFALPRADPTRFPTHPFDPTNPLSSHALIHSSLIPQASCIPVVLGGRDVCGSAVTGSGKTAAYGLPLLERLLHRPKQVSATYVLVLVPTRELAAQVARSITQLARFATNPKPIGVATCVGGLSAHQQARDLRLRPEIVVATPNRLIDLLRNHRGVHMEGACGMSTQPYPTQRHERLTLHACALQCLFFFRSLFPTISFPMNGNAFLFPFRRPIERRAG